MEHNPLTDPVDPIGLNRPLMPHGDLGWHPGITLGLAVLAGVFILQRLRKRIG